MKNKTGAKLKVCVMLQQPSRSHAPPSQDCPVGREMRMQTKQLELSRALGFFTLDPGSVLQHSYRTADTRGTCDTVPEVGAVEASVDSLVDCKAEEMDVEMDLGQETKEDDMKIGVTAGATQATGCFRRSCSAWRVSCRTLLLSHVPGAGPVTLGWRTRPTRMFFVSTTRVCQVCAPGPLTKAAPKGLLPSRCLELLSFVFSRGHGSCFYPALEGPAWGQEDAHVDHLDGDPLPTAPPPWADDVGCTGSRSLRVEPCSELSSDRISS